MEISLQRTGRTSQGTQKTLLLLTETGIVYLLRPTSHGREQLGLREAGFGITPSLPPTSGGSRSEEPCPVKMPVHIRDT